MTKWMTTAMGEIGTQEIIGKTHNKRIVDYFLATGYHPGNDETPWCGAFVAWCFREAGVKYEDVRIRAAAAREWLKFGKTLKEPIFGALMVLQRGGPNSSSGHVTFFVEWVDKDNGIFKGLGGNQGNTVNVKEFKMDDVLDDGVRWPAEIPLPVSEQPLGKSGVIRWSGAGLAGFFALIADNIGTITESFRMADNEFSRGSVLSAVAAGLILAALIGTIMSRAKGKKDEQKIQEGLDRS